MRLHFFQVSWFSDEEDAAITPAELVDFNSEVSVERSWSKKVGSGTKNYLVSLRPTASSDTIFAADYEGQVMALNPSNGQTNWQVDLEAMVSGGVAHYLKRFIENNQFRQNSLRKLPL